MAKGSSPPIPQPAQLSTAEMRAVIGRFKSILADLEKFDPQSVRTRSDPRIDVLEASINEALMDAFGHETPQYMILPSGGDH